MKIVSDNLKNALDKPTTQRKGRILVGDNYYDVYNVEYYADCYDDGNVIGNAIASQLDFDLPYMPRFNTFQYFDGVWTGNEYEYVDFGTFNVFDEKDQDEFNKHITAFDNLIKFNAPFIAKEDYPKTLYEELVNICEQAGVELENTSITNGSFILENNQFVGGENLKTVLKAICGISGNYAIIKDDILKLQLKNDTDIIISKSQHKPMTWKRKSYGFNQLIIGMKDVEGEYSIRQDLEDIEKNGVHKLVINDNPFAYTPEKREELIDELFAQIKGFGYVPYELEGEWLNYVEVGDVVTIEGIETMILRINGKSPNSVESLMSAPAIIDSAVDYLDNTADLNNILRNYRIVIDRHEGTITQIASETSTINNKLNENSNQINTIATQVTQNAESVTTSIQQLTQTINTNNTNVQNDINNINDKLNNGIETLKNTLVTIDINGISVTTNTSAISTLLSNDRFSIKTKSGEELFFVGYDYDLQKTVSRIDNLTVTTYLTSGYHRTEGVIIDGEYRSCDFYVGV